MLITNSTLTPVLGDIYDTNFWANIKCTSDNDTPKISNYRLFASLFTKNINYTRNIFLNPFLLGFTRLVQRILSSSSVTLNINPITSKAYLDEYPVAFTRDHIIITLQKGYPSSLIAYINSSNILAYPFSLVNGEIKDVSDYQTIFNQLLRANNFVLINQNTLIFALSSYYTFTFDLSNNNYQISELTSTNLSGEIVQLAKLGSQYIIAFSIDGNIEALDIQNTQSKDVNTTQSFTLTQDIQDILATDQNIKLIYLSDDTIYAIQQSGSPNYSNYSTILKCGQKFAVATMNTYGQFILTILDTPNIAIQNDTILTVDSTSDVINSLAEYLTQAKICNSSLNVANGKLTVQGSFCCRLKTLYSVLNFFCSNG